LASPPGSLDCLTDLCTISDAFGHQTVDTQYLQGFPVKQDLTCPTGSSVIAPWPHAFEKAWPIHRAHAASSSSRSVFPAS